MGTGFRKRSCSNKQIERDDDSKKNHPALDAGKLRSDQRCTTAPLDDDTGQHRSGAEAAREDAQRASRESRTAERRRGRRGARRSGELSRRHPGEAHLFDRQGPVRRARPRLVRGNRACRARPRHRPLDGLRPARPISASRSGSTTSRSSSSSGGCCSRRSAISTSSTRRARRSPGLASTSSASARPNRTRRSGTAASGGLPPASWRAWRASRCRLTATASATITACFARPSSTAGSTSCRRIGSPAATLGSSSAPRWSTRSASAARSSMSPRAASSSASGSPTETVLAAAYDTPVVGWRGRHVNTLRLWSARAADPLQLETFNLGDYVGALAHRARAEAISRVLYPSDATMAGQELRLRQEYFFTSASLQDLVRRHLQQYGTLSSLAEQVGDPAQRHPSGDRRRGAHAAPRRRARAAPGRKPGRSPPQTLSYTNHTLLPEALETWPVAMLERLLPRHMQIIYLINWLHLEQLAERAGPLDAGAVAAVSLIDETQERRVRMGHLAFLGSHKVNGVSALHTELMRKTVFKDLHALYPDRIVNKTNGITFRRWLHQANPRLTRPPRRGGGTGDPRRSRRAAPDRAAGDRRRLPGPLRGPAPSRQGSPGAADRRAASGQRRSGGPVRRADQAHPRIQAPAPQHPRDHRPLPGDQGRAAPGLAAAGEDLRRQGGGELCPREAHHQARERRRPGRERRSATCAAD